MRPPVRKDSPEKTLSSEIGAFMAPLHETNSQIASPGGGAGVWRALPPSQRRATSADGVSHWPISASGNLAAVCGPADSARALATSFDNHHLAGAVEDDLATALPIVWCA